MSSFPQTTPDIAQKVLQVIIERQNFYYDKRMTEFLERAHELGRVQQLACEVDQKVEKIGRLLVKKLDLDAVDKDEKSAAPAGRGA